MDMKNNKEQLPPGKQIFGFARGSRLPPVPEKEMAPLPTREEVNAANSGEYAPSTRKVEKIGKNRLLKAAIGGGVIVGAGAIAYEAVPAVHRTVDSLFLDNIKGKLFSSSEVSTTNPKAFDNTKETQVITPAMIKRVPQEEIQKLDTFARLANQKTEIISLAQGAPAKDVAANPSAFPELKFQIGEDKNTILLLYPLDLSSSSNPNLEIKLTKEYGGMRQADSDYLKGKEYYDTITYEGKGKPIPKGTVVNFPVVSENGGYMIMNTHGDGYLYFQSNDGIKYRLDVYAVKGEGNESILFKPLVDAPVLTDEFKEILKDKGVTAGFHVRSDQAILQTTEDVDSISIYTTAAKKDGVSVSTFIFVPTNMELFVSPDNQLLTSEK